MDVHSNATSYTSPLAHAPLKLHQAALASGSGIVGRIWAQLNIWTVLLTLLLVLATYDQCEYCPSFHANARKLTGLRRQLPMAQTWNRRACVEAAVHRPILGVDEAGFQKVQGEMGER